jgi:hypothetical protein
MFAVLLPLSVTAQQRMITGRVVAGSQPVANQPVSLHRVTNAGGSTISVDTTAADGSFQLPFDSFQGEALHFVATRWEGQLYIGDTFRQPVSGEYRLAVGPGVTPIEVGDAVRTTPEAPPVDRSGQTAGLVVILVAALVLGGIIAWAARPRPAQVRRLLLEIAALDNRHDQATLGNYDVQRSELLRRLRESA